MIMERHSCAGRNPARIIRYIFFYAVVGVVTNNHHYLNPLFPQWPRRGSVRSVLRPFASLRETFSFAFLFS